MENLNVDYALAVEALYGVAEYGKAETYADLVRTWRDIRPLPSQEALRAAWRGVRGKIDVPDTENRLKRIEARLAALEARL